MISITRRLSILTTIFLVASCAEIKEAGRDIGHATRDAATAIGHGTRDAAKEIGHGTQRVVDEALED